jgi:hypothetical protein
MFLQYKKDKLEKGGLTSMNNKKKINVPCVIVPLSLFPEFDSGRVALCSSDPEIFDFSMGDMTYWRCGQREGVAKVIFFGGESCFIEKIN